MDEKLKRLHSLLFGADLALKRGDFTTALILGLRLLGFLDSNSQNPVDAAFINPIRVEALSKIDSARRSLAPESDRYVSQNPIHKIIDPLIRTSIGLFL